MLWSFPIVLLASMTQPGIYLGKGNPRGIGHENKVVIVDLEGDRYAAFQILAGGNLKEIHSWRDLPGIDALVAPFVAKEGEDVKFLLHDGQQRIFWELGTEDVRKFRTSLELGWHNWLVANERVAVGSWKHSEQIAFESGKRVQPLSEIMEKRSRDYFDYLVIQIPEQREFVYLESGFIDRCWIYSLDGTLKRNLRFSWPTAISEVQSRHDAQTLMTISSGFIAGGMVFLNYQEDGFPLESHVFDLNGGDHLLEKEGQIIHLNPQGIVVTIVERDGDFFLETTTLNQ